MSEFHIAKDATKRELLAFLIGTQEFCVDIMGVREIRVWTPATPVAHAPAFMVGVINLRGAVLPIIDLAIRLGLPPTMDLPFHLQAAFAFKPIFTSASKNQHLKVCGRNLPAQSRETARMGGLYGCATSCTAWLWSQAL